MSKPSTGSSFMAPGSPVSGGLQPVPEIVINKDHAQGDTPSRAAKKTKTPLASAENTVVLTSESMPDVGEQRSSGKVKSPKKLMKSSSSSNSRDETKISATESLPEVKSKTASKSKARVVASRYKESAKSRAVATPTKMSDSSCISINQSKLFSTATASTPVSAGGKVQDVSVKPKGPPKMAPLDSTVRQRPAAVPATAAAAIPGKDKPPLKIKKANKTATVKVKPLRAEAPPKAQKSADKERVSDHQLLYNQYLQWTYMCRMSEAAARTERPQLSLQARQLSGLVETARQNCTELERKLQAVTLYREMAQLERQLNTLLDMLNESAGAVRADLSQLATTLDATRSRLQLSGWREPTDAQTFVEELVAAAERCREALESLDAAVSPHANLLQHTAEAVDALQTALRHSAHSANSSSELLQELSSLALQEASLSLCAGTAEPPPRHGITLTSSG